MRQYVVAAGAIALVIGLPTDVIPNPVFGRPVPVTWWSYPTLIVTAVLGGLLGGTYVRRDSARATVDEIDTPTRNGGVAGPGVSVRRLVVVGQVRRSLPTAG